MMRKYMMLGGLLVGLLVVVAAVGGGAPSVHGWDETQEDDQTGSGASPEGEIPFVEDTNPACSPPIIEAKPWVLEFGDVCKNEFGSCTVTHIKIIYQHGHKTEVRDDILVKCDDPNHKNTEKEQEACDQAKKEHPELCGVEQPAPTGNPTPNGGSPAGGSDSGGNITTGGNGNLTSWGVASSTPKVGVNRTNIAPAPARPDPRNFWTLR